MMKEVIPAFVLASTLTVSTAFAAPIHKTKQKSLPLVT